METATVTKIRVRIEHDECADDPIGDWDGQWKFYQFDSGWKHYADRETVLARDEDGNLEDFELVVRLAAGLAFPVHRYEHGLCQWSQGGDVDDCDGMLIWEDPIEDLGPESIEDRRKDAQWFLDIHTDWCNGSVYGYVIEKITEDECEDEEEEIDSAWGFFGTDSDYMLEEIESAIRRAGCESLEIEYTGDCAWLAK